jgi:hypothetical protein
MMIIVYIVVNLMKENKFYGKIQKEKVICLSSGIQNV